MTNLENDDVKTWTDFIKTNEMIGMVVGTKDGDLYIKGGEITLAINEDGGTTAKIQADVIDIDGLVKALKVVDLTVNSLTVTNGFDAEHIDCGSIDCTYIGTNAGDVACGGTVDTAALKVDSTSATWQSKQISTPIFGTRRYFLYAASSGSTTPTGTTNHYPITNHTESTIHYLGGAST
jgi:hypothetical protein